MWFVGVYQVIAGQGDADWARLAARGWIALLASAFVGVGASLVANRRALGNTLEPVTAGGVGRSPVIRVADLLGRLIARHPAERGFFSFSVLTILRSPWHRLVMSVSAGVAVALAMVALDSATMAPDGASREPMRAAHALAMQWVLLAVVLAGVRVAASVPAELRASWLLRMLEADRPARWMAGFRKAVLVSLVGPSVALMAVAMSSQYGWHTIWRLGLAALLFAGVAFEVLFLGFGRVPFACPTGRETGDARIRWPLMVALFTILVVPMAELTALGLRSTAGTATLLATGAAAAGTLRWRGNLAMARQGGLAFEPEDRGTQALGLQP